MYNTLSLEAIIYNPTVLEHTFSKTFINSIYFGMYPFIVNSNKNMFRTDSTVQDAHKVKEF